MSTATEAPEIPTVFLKPDSEAPRLARRFLAECFAEWGIEDDYLGRLIICELVTNSFLHGEGEIVVRVFREERDGRVVVEVQDAGPEQPVVRPEDGGATSGRGLLLMTELVDDWGVRPLAEEGRSRGRRFADGTPDPPGDRRPLPAMAHVAGPGNGRPLPGSARRGAGAARMALGDVLPGVDARRYAAAADLLTRRSGDRPQRPGPAGRPVGVPRGRARTRRVPVRVRRRQVRRAGHRPFPSGSVAAAVWTTP
ncbi:ATP-binding protein [Actinomadura sp. 7K507]|nr:ATP-binding protein [Actinomadura sp. 7K507]